MDAIYKYLKGKNKYLMKHQYKKNNKLMAFIYIFRK